MKNTSQQKVPARQPQDSLEELLRRDLEAWIMAKAAVARARRSAG